MPCYCDCHEFPKIVEFIDTKERITITSSQELPKGEREFKLIISGEQLKQRLLCKLETMRTRNVVYNARPSGQR